MADWEDRQFGKGTLQENLRAAVARGDLIDFGDDTWSLAREQRAQHYLQVKAPRYLGCDYLNRFLFEKAFDQAAVPYGCRNCYKVKMAPRTLRELVALRELLEGVDYQSKCGVDFYNPHSQDFYAGFLYLDGLEEARAAHHHLRGLIDADARLERDIPITIKRGCSNYEVACGPADLYEFPEVLADIEAALRPKFKPADRSDTEHAEDYRIRRATAMVGWIDFAYRIKDDTYLDFTEGRPLYPKTVAYSPD